MENKEHYQLAPGETTLANFFRWVRSEVVRHLNKLWVVDLPPNSGWAVFRDSREKITLDLTQVRLRGNANVVVEADLPLVVTEDVVGDVTTYTVALHEDYAPREMVVIANGVDATADVLATEPVPI